jgi:hypothetical protein
VFPMEHDAMTRPSLALFSCPFPYKVLILTNNSSWVAVCRCVTRIGNPYSGDVLAMVVLLCCLLCLVWAWPISAQMPSRPLPRLDASSLQYTGAFRLPRTVIPSDATTPIYWSYSGGPMAYHPVRQTLYIGTRESYVAEVVIPTPVSSSVLTALPVATHGQPATDPTSRTWANLGVNGAVIENGAIFGGILFSGERMVLSATPYYPGSGSQQVVSHGTASPSWQVDGKQWSGWKTVGPPGHGGYLGGWMLLVPHEWQAALGGPALTGQGAIPIISRTSWGPALSAFDPGQLATTSPVPVLPLLEYSSSHPTLGGYADTPSLPFNRTALVSGAIFPPGTRSILFLGASVWGRRAWAIRATACGLRRSRSISTWGVRQGAAVTVPSCPLASVVATT